MTPLAWWLLLLFLAGPVGWVASLIRRDHNRTLAAEAETRQLRRDLVEQTAHVEELTAYLGRVEESHAASVAEWADRCRAANAVAIALDVEERTS